MPRSCEAGGVGGLVRIPFTAYVAVSVVAATATAAATMTSRLCVRRRTGAADDPAARAARIATKAGSASTRGASMRSRSSGARTV